MLYTVKLYYADGESKISVHADDDEEAIAKAWNRFRRSGAMCLPMAYTNAEIIEREETEEG